MFCEFGRRGLGLFASTSLAVRPAQVAVKCSTARSNHSVGCRRINHCGAHRLFHTDMLVSRYISLHISKPDHCCLMLVPMRWLSGTGAPWQQRKEVTERKTRSDDQKLTLGKKVAETSKTVSYGGIILVGLGVIGMVFFTLGKELFSSKSPNGVYTKTLKMCKNNLEIQDCLGTPIKGYGEMTRRRRRRHVSHLEYSQDGVNFLRMKFYLEGPERKGTVHLEMKENESGRYEYRYLFVELDGYPSRTIVLEDNR